MNNKKNEPVDIESTYMKKTKTCAQWLQDLRKEAAECGPEWRFDYDIDDFLISVACLTPQAYGSRIPNYFSKKLSLLPSNNKERGDKMTRSNLYYEWKVSLLTSSNDVLNLVQIRSWQDTNYIFGVFDIRDLSNITYKLFHLTKNQMESEMRIIKTSSAHGTKEAISKNMNNELAMRIKVTHADYNRWVNEYGILLDDLRLKLNPSEDD